MIRNRKQIAIIIAIALIIGFQMNDCMSQAFSVSESQPLPTDPQRVKIIQTTKGSTIGTHDGVRLRGVPMAYSVADAKDPYESKIYNSNFYKTARNMGFNAVRCFVEQFDVFDEAKTLESLAVLDTIVNMTSKYGMQLMLNAGNIGYFRDHTPDELKRLIEYNKIINGILATRYKNRTHVIFEQQNEPTYNASSLNGRYPTMVQDIADCYNIMRTAAPDSHISLFTFMISCGYSMVEMVEDLDTKTSIDWTKTTVAFHGYGPPCNNIDQIAELMVKYPVVETEFWPEKNMGEGGYGTPYEMEGIEDNEISWFTWWLHTGETALNIYEPIFADLESIGKMWDFTTIDLQEPIVKCGNDTIVFLPQSTITLKGLVTDNGTIVKYNWVLMKQPENANLIFTQNNEMAELSNMIKGSYHFRLFVWDNDNNYSYDDITVVSGNLQNIPGKIEAEDYSAAYGIGGTSAIGWIGIGDYTEYFVDIASSGLYSINVSASAAAGYGGTGHFLIDGVPVSSIFTVTTSSSSDDWNTFLPAYCSAQLPAGRHILRWEPVNVLAYNIDCFTFTKTEATFETTADQTIKLPINSTLLTASVTDPSGIKSYMWKVMSGKKGYILSGETTNTLTFSNLIEGEYVLSIEVTTNSNVVLSKNIKVTVQPCIDNPIVSAGNDKKFALPTNSTEITAIASASGSEIESYTWEKISGPEVFAMANENTQTVSLSNLVAGFYNFRITVISTNGCVAWDEVMVKVFTAVGIENTETNVGTVVIYPNPAKNEVIIARKTLVDTHAIVTLMNTKGQILKQDPWSSERLIWSIEGYSSGVYIISIFEKGKINHLKLLIE